jgi:hypothetical protein
LLYELQEDEFLSSYSRVAAENKFGSTPESGEGNGNDFAICTEDPDNKYSFTEAEFDPDISSQYK